MISFVKFLLVSIYFPETNSRLKVPKILKIIIVAKDILYRVRIAGNICFEDSCFIPIPQQFMKSLF